MPATKSKKRKVTRSRVTSQKTVTAMSQQTSMLLFVFALSMMAFAFVLYTVYA